MDGAEPPIVSDDNLGWVANEHTPITQRYIATLMVNLLICTHFPGEIFRHTASGDKENMHSTRKANYKHCLEPCQLARVL
jgi:hypothetical protein